MSKPAPPLPAANEAEKRADANTRLDELYHQYKALMRRVILRTCPRELGVPCDDIEQEAWLGVWSVLKGEREITYPTSYIYRVAVSAAVRAIQRAKARREESLQVEGDGTDAPVHTLYAPPGESPYNIAQQQELREKIEAALARLPENRRIGVGLHLQGLTTNEIGALLGWSEPKARNLVHRGLKDLRKSLRALGIEESS